MSVDLIKWSESNVTGNDMGNFLAGQVQKCTQIDILTGYFFFDGIKSIQEALEKNPDLTLRILVGMDAGFDTKGLACRVYEHERCYPPANIGVAYIESLEQFFAKFPAEQITEEQAKLFDHFSTMISRGKLQLRKTRVANHSKLYIFHKTDGPVSYSGGSSNFTYSGLMKRQEFNIHVSDDPKNTRNAAMAFNELWDQAVAISAFSDKNADYCNKLKNSNPTSTVAPFDAYMKLMHEYLKMHESAPEIQQRIREILQNTYHTDKDGKKQQYKEMAYQVDAVSEAVKILQACGGVIIADVVGLGKSVIASLLAKLSCKPGIFLVPAHLVPNWETYIEDFGLENWYVKSMDNLESLQGEEFINSQMIIIDEAHNLRNPEVQVYQTLQTAMLERDVVLLTATPFNNKPEDLWSLIDLIGKFDKSELKSKFDSEKKKYNEIIDLLRTTYNNDLMQVPEEKKKEFETIAERIRSLVSPFIIRRNRKDLLDPGSPYKDLMKDLIPTQQPPINAEFELTEKQADFYEKILNNYFAGDNKEFKGAMYQPQVYVSGNKTKQDGSQSQSNLYGMICRFMVCRWESSPAAFYATLKTLQSALNQYIHRFEKHCIFVQIYDRNKDFSNLNADDNVPESDYAFEDIEALLKKLTCAKHKKDIYYKNGCTLDISGTGADIIKMNEDAAAAFLADLKHDSAVLEKIENELIACGMLKPENDGKFAALKKELKKIFAGDYEKDGDKFSDSNPRKVIIFSGYADTAKYLKENLELEKEFSGKTVFVQGKDCITPEKRKEIYAEIESHFKASVKTASSKEKMILICTDVLSEGVNLNQAGVVINYDLSYNPVRVIQRIGRINRIDTKVFENIYNINFFPSAKDINTLGGIAVRKMHAIHSIVCEDAQVLSLEENPVAFKAAETDKSKLTSALSDNTPLGELSQIRKMYQEGLQQLSADPAAHTAYKKKLDLLAGRFSMMPGAENSLYIFYRNSFSISAVRLKNVYDTSSTSREMGLLSCLKELTIAPDIPGMKFEVSESNPYYKARLLFENGEGFPPEDLPGPNDVAKIVEACKKIGVRGNNTLKKLKLFVQSAAGMKQVKKWVTGQNKEEGKKAIEEALANFSSEKEFHKNKPDFFMAVGLNKETGKK